MKSNSVMSHAIVNGIHVWTFNDGKKLEFDPAKATATAAEARDHGYTQKIGDAAAMTRDTKTGKPATVAEKRAAMERVVASLYAGQWNAPRAEGGDDTILAEALARLYPKKSAEALAKYLSGLTKEQKAELQKSSAKLQPHLAAIRAERAIARAKAAGIDGDKLLDGFKD